MLGWLVNQSGSWSLGNRDSLFLDVTARPINYRGTGPAVHALVAGEVQVMFSGAGSVMSHAGAGRLRALAVTTAQPTPLVPGMPTVAASGVPGFEYTSVIGFLAPAKTPPAIVNLLSQEIGNRRLF